MNETYLIFVRNAHSVIYFVQASSINEAIGKYVSSMDDKVVLQADGSVLSGDDQYPHLLAYIEANEKRYGEWQIRKLPDWVWQTPLVEAFCGESKDGPARDIEECRKHFVEAFPKSRAKAFVWYLKQGTLVTFYRKQGPFNIEVLKRYLIPRRYIWDPNSHILTVEEWDGDYQKIVDSFSLEPYKVE